MKRALNGDYSSAALDRLAADDKTAARAYLLLKSKMRHASQSSNSKILSLNIKIASLNNKIASLMYEIQHNKTAFEKQAGKSVSEDTIGIYTYLGLQLRVFNYQVLTNLFFWFVEVLPMLLHSINVRDNVR